MWAYILHINMYEEFEFEFVRDESRLETIEFEVFRM